MKRLTEFNLSCGYMEIHEKERYNRVSLSFGNGCYHIRGFLKGEHFALTSRTLTQARKEFDRMRRLINDK